MAFTAAQNAIVKADIAVNPDLNSNLNNSDGNSEIARLYMLNTSPGFTVWKTVAMMTEVSKAINGVELAGLTANNHTRLQTVSILWVEGGNPSLPDQRAMFDDIFSGTGGANTRANLLKVWKRLATRIEKLLIASGTGTDASPATLGFEGGVSYQDIEGARNS